MDSFYIIAQYSYENIEIAICQKGCILQSASIHKHVAVQETLNTIQKLLDLNNLHLSDIKFICINTGPGPYNTLRALITMANGIHFAQKIPLLQAQALDLMLKEEKHQNALVILNAFAGHVFYAFKTNSSEEQGYCSINKLIEKIKEKKQVFNISGNGVICYKDQLTEVSQQIKTPENISLFNRLTTLANYAYQQTENNYINHGYLKPTYLESPAVK